MMQVLNPTYTLRVEIKDRMREPQSLINTVQAAAAVNVPPFGGGEMRPPKPEPLHKYFDGLAGKTGCDEVVQAVKDALMKYGITNASVSLERFEHR